MIRPLDSRLSSITAVPILAMLYMFNPGPLVSFIALLFLTGFTFAVAALLNELFYDMTWAVVAGGSAYWGLSLIAPRPLSLTVALTVMLIFFVIPLSNNTEDWWSDGWSTYNTVALTAVVIGGVYLGSYLTPWIVMSPFLELVMEKASRFKRNESHKAWGIYYSVIYALSLYLDPILMLYIASVSLVRQFKPGLSRFKVVPIDSLIRLSLWVTAVWITGL